jgi:hypothetical protein
MKKTILLHFIIFCTVFTQAQSIKPVSKDHSFQDSLNMVVVDFKNNFRNIQSNPLPAEIDADTYQSTICLPGATHCVIMRYHSVVDNSASWQAILYTGESYEEAVNTYKKIFDLIKKSKIKGIDLGPAGFEGSLENPDENVRFTVSSLRLKAADTRYKNFTADVEIVGNYDGWEVHLNLYNKKKDTDGGNVQ